jgi:hypothetical protein
MDVYHYLYFWPKVIEPQNQDEACGYCKTRLYGIPTGSPHCAAKCCFDHPDERLSLQNDIAILQRGSGPARDGM